MVLDGRLRIVLKVGRVKLLLIRDMESIVLVLVSLA